MTKEDIWRILGIEPTTDEGEIVNAYRTALVKTNPEDNPEGFKRLREAFDLAMAGLKEAAENPDGEGESGEPVEKTEVDLHIDKADEIYKNIFTRIDEDKWKEWLKDPIVNELDTADKVREMFLAYCMGHFQFPHKIWKLFDSVFNYRAEKSVLVEMFPEDYLNFINYQAENESFIDYYNTIERSEYQKKLDELGLEIHFEATPGIYEPEVFEVHDDTYIKEMSYMHANIDRVLKLRYSDYLSKEEQMENEEERAKSEKEELDFLKAILIHLQTYDIFNPLELAGDIRALYLEGRFEEADRLAGYVIDGSICEKIDVYVKATALLVSLMVEEKLDKLSDAILDEREAMIDELLKDNSDSIMCLEVKGLIKLLRKEYEDSSDYIIKALDISSRNSEAVMLLKRNSDESIEYYENKMAEGTATEHEKMELAWSYFRLEKPEETLDVLKQVTPDEELYYGYNNLHGRCYFNQDKFEEAFPYLEKWVEMIEVLEARDQRGEELSKKDKERLDRIGFCYYMFAACANELGKIDIAIENYKTAIDKTVDNYTDLNELLYYQENYGQLLMKKGDYQAAMDVWNDMIKRVDHCVPAYIHRQKTAFEMRDAQLVIDDYYNIIRDVPQYADAYYLAARVFDIYNQRSDVEAVFKRAEEAGLESDKIMTLKARILARDDKPQEALEVYKEIDKRIDNEESDITEKEDLTDFYADVAGLLLNMRDEKGNRNRLRDAEEYVKKGRKIEKDNKRLYWIMTDITEWENRGPEKVYEKMLELFPDDSNIDYEYGEYFNRKKDREKAETCYRNCLKKYPEHRSANNKLMDIYQMRYSNTEDPEDYKRAVEFAVAQLENDDDDFYYVESALLYIDGYEFEKALRDATRASEKNPTNVYAHNARGLALMKMDRFKEALPCFDKSIECMENNETVNPFVNAARCLEALEDYTEALHYLEMARERFDNPTAVMEPYARILLKVRAIDKAVSARKDNEKYYESRRKESKNTWYEHRVLKEKYRRYDIAILSGNPIEAERILNDDINVFLRENGYFAIDTYIKPKTGGERVRVAFLLKELADFYLYSVRDYKKAVHFYEEAVRYWATEDAAKKKKILGIVNMKELPRPEDTRTGKRDLDDIARLYVNFATACNLSGDKTRSGEFAKRALECIIKGYGSEDDYLTFNEYKPDRMRVLAQIMYYMGQGEKALKLVDEMDRCARCQHCDHSVCYEKHLMLARIYEMEKNFAKAKEYYRKAFELSPDDSEVYQALRDLEK
ncbi:MAG: tetratricopeptide repeat protein [Eubacterium sp.]|nr:tetratricopeptide repeat protein [Eubacterium sp.]